MYAQTHKLQACKQCGRRIKQAKKDLSPTNLVKHLQSCDAAAYERYKRKLELYKGQRKARGTPPGLGFEIAPPPAARGTMLGFFKPAVPGEVVTPPPPPKSRSFTFDKLATDKLVARAVVEENLPLSFPYSKGIRRVFASLRPSYVPVKKGNLMEVSAAAALQPS